MTDKEKEYKMNQLFNTFERPIMIYISKLLGETPSSLYVDNIPDIEIPIILRPDSTKNDVNCLRFKLKVVPYDYISDVSTYLPEQVVKDTIGYILYGIKNVYPSIVTSMINKTKLETTTLELDTENWSFKPVFTHELKLIKTILEYKLGEIDPVNKEYNDIVNQLSVIDKQILDLGDIDDIEFSMNEKYKTAPRLSITIDTIKYSNVLELQKKFNNKKHIKNMPPITGGIYT